MTLSDEDRIKCLQALRIVAMSGGKMNGFISRVSLANCFVNTAPAINPYDKGFKGLLTLLSYRRKDYQYDTLDDIEARLTDRLVNFEDSLQFIFHPGIELIIEAMAEPAGLSALDQFFGILQKQALTEAYAQVANLSITDPAMGTKEEPAYALCAAVSHIHFEAHGEFKPDIIIRDILVSTSLTDLLAKANDGVLGLFREYEAIMERADETIFTLESLFVLKNTVRSIEIPLEIRMGWDQEFKLSDHYQKIEIVTDNKDFLAELRKTTSPGNSRHFLKGRLLEQELGF
jgi:hypothetical protein